MLSASWAQPYGPDAYGYTADTTQCPWIDITTRTGAQQLTGLMDDNSVGPLDFNWSFQYYWSSYSMLKVGSNGWLSFDNPSNIAWCFPTLPSIGGGENILGPLMTDLNFLGTGNVAEAWFWTNNVDTAVVSYLNVPFWESGPVGYFGSNTFQVIFAGTDSTIRSPGWLQAGAGAAIYMERVTPIRSVDVWPLQVAANPANNSGFDIVIRDGNDPPGQGAILASETVAAGSYTPGGRVRVPITGLFNLPAGGRVYVAWIANGDSVDLGSEGYGPISLRSYEIFGSVWAPYRNRETEDLLIYANVDTIGYCTSPMGRPDDPGEATFSVYPNPGGEAPTLTYELTEPALVTVSILDLMGREVKHFNFDRESPGQYSKWLKATGLESGVYLIRFQVENEVGVRKWILKR